MSGEEWIGWRAFDAISPIDGQRQVRQSALIAAILGNVHRGPNQEPRSVDDYDLYRERKVLTREEEEARFREAFDTAGLLVVKG